MDDGGWLRETSGWCTDCGSWTRRSELRKVRDSAVAVVEARCDGACWLGSSRCAASFEQIMETSEASRPGVDGYPFSDMRRVSIEYVGSGES